MPSALQRLRSGVQAHLKLVIFGVVVAILAIVGTYLSRGQVIQPPNSFASCANQGYIVTNTDPPACLDGKKTFVGPRDSNEPSQPPLTSQPFQVLVDGDSHGNYPRGNQIITTDAQWRSYWNAIHAWVNPIPVILSVDFTSQEVLAISEGKEVTSGYTYEITSVNSGPTGTVVDVQETIPTVTCQVTNSPSDRYFIVATAKLAPPVSFNVSVNHRNCSLP